MEDKIKLLKERSMKREDLLERIVKFNDPINNYRDQNNYLVLAREWNSWYPSTFHVSGGCYFFNLNEEIIVIDPGFNTLEKITEHQLDIRLIRHVFVTHFHPDHFNNLSKLLTRLPSSENKISVYLNSTTYNQFKIYMRDNTEFFELKPGNIITLKSPEIENAFKIEVEITNAFHREIGGYMNSVGLKFILKNTYEDEEKKYIIGFMSDTDGSEKYIDSYVEDYNDCDILIPHFGAIHKTPTGYKHLYLEGTKKLLKKLNYRKDSVIFLGEFGMELASNQLFYKGLNHLVSPKLSYIDLATNIFKILHSKPQENDLNYLNPIIVLLTTRCEEIISTLKGFPFFNFEVLLPFMLFNQSFLELNKSNDMIILPKDLEEKIEFFIENVEEKELRSVWWNILKKVAFHVDENNGCIERITKFMDSLGLKELRENIEENGKLIMPYFSDKFKEKLSFSNIIPRKGNSLSSLNSLLSRIFNIKKESVKDIIHNVLLEDHPFSEEIVEFYNRDNPINIKFSNFNLYENPRLKWFILTITIFFLLKVSEFTESEAFKEFEDGREIICKSLQEELGKCVIPVHESYKISFNKSGINCIGYCENHHEFFVPIHEINHNWRFCRKQIKDSYKIKRKNTNKKFINIISKEKCFECIKNSLQEAFFSEEEKEWNEKYGDSLTESYKSEIQAYEMELKKVSNFKELFDLYSKDTIGLISGINSRILKKKVIQLIKNTQLNVQEIILYLIHPILVQNSIIIDLIKKQLKRLGNKEIMELIYKIFNNPSPYEEIDQEPVYLYLFFNNDFSKLMCDKIEKDVDLQFLIKAVEYLDKLKKYKENYLNRCKIFLQFVKKNLIEVLYPLIEDPDSHKNDYDILKSNSNFTICLNNLGPPFDIYADYINNNLWKGVIDPKTLKLIKESLDRVPKYRFL